ncbi:MAG: hypothetical protein DSZ28_03605 [Thiothrix sp.]|nr:MAG: hypothetical protein DSZ28_03605 [Thiothrix sp.]
MKKTLMGLILLTIAFAILFSISSNAVSDDNSGSAQMVSTPSPVSVEANHPLAMAHQKLDHAKENYSKGDIDAVQQDLEAASKWLKDPRLSNNTKAKDEAVILANEIQALQEEISHPSDEHEGTIARIWHRTTALVQHEIQHVKKSWSDTSTANKTMKHLLDAKLHFTYAEHDLFVAHNREKANKEISRTIIFLDEAEKVAIPRIREQIATIKNDMQILTDSRIYASEQEKIMSVLMDASQSIQEVSQGVALPVQSKLQTLAIEIGSLKNEIGTLESRQQYNAILEKFRKLNNEL